MGTAWFIPSLFHSHSPAALDSGTPWGPGLQTGVTSGPVDGRLLRVQSWRLFSRQEAVIVVGKTLGHSVHRRRLARAVNGRLYFAGEATSWRYPATVHGAYLSGVRVADEIMARTDRR